MRGYLVAGEEPEMQVPVSCAGAAADPRFRICATAGNAGITHSAWHLSKTDRSSHTDHDCHAWLF